MTNWLLLGSVRIGLFARIGLLSLVLTSTGNVTTAWNFEVHAGDRAVLLNAVDPQASPEYFEVVSVKPSSPDCALVMIGPSPDGFHLHCLTFLQLVQYAYGLNLFEENVLGLPKWAVNDRFDLDAPIQPDDLVRFNELSPLEKAKTLRTTLEDRFGLHAHEESRTLPVYALVRGKHPLKLKPTDPAFAKKPTLLSRGRNLIVGYHCTIQEFANYASPVRGRRVIDRTEITGKYDFTLEFTPEANTPPISNEDSAPSLFVAVQEQMGLQLIATKASVRVLVVDAVNRPQPN